MRYSLILLVCISIICFSCKKYLDEKPDIKLAIPSSLEDFQKLMDQPELVDNSIPQVGDLACDDYYFTFPNFQSRSLTIQSIYTWNKEIWQGGTPEDWKAPYSNIYICNVVLEGLDNFQALTSYDQTTKNSIYGHALFIRAQMHYSLEEIFGQPYRPGSQNSDLGIPLKLTANLANRSVRSSVEAVYNQILDDLLRAKDLLPKFTIAKSRPSKAAAFALLSRVYLTMQDYVKAGAFADSALNINGELFDYNKLTAAQAASNSPFSSFPALSEISEVIFPSSTREYAILSQTIAMIDSNLYASYNINDWRRTVFFRPTTVNGITTYSIKGGYSASTLRTFGGLAVDEMYLTRAECYARSGNKDAALADLNALIRMRWKNNNTWVPFTATDADDALRKILIERRKELIFRAIRWTDLRRLNQDTSFDVQLKRNLNGQTYTLEPNDKRYTFPIPDIEILLSGLEQNPR